MCSFIKNLCLKAGVKVVQIPCLQESSIASASRWVNNSPLIQLATQKELNDNFWFTFFHLSGHILLHGKKFISLENVNYEGKNEEKEKESDNFALSYLNESLMKTP